MLFLPLMVSAETYDLPTSKGKEQLIIPDTYDELRSAYIEIASLYIEERYAHEESLDQIDRLLSLHEEYKSYFHTLESTTQDLIRELSKDQSDFFRLYIGGHYRYNILAPAPNVGIDFQIQLFESFNIMISYEVPVSFTLSVGGRLY